MYQQMDIFDFIEKSPESKQEQFQTQFEQLFNKVRDPVLSCTNCLCKYCGNNVEELWRTVKAGEMRKPCFNCDECRIYSGDYKDSLKIRENCANFILSDYGAKRNRRKIHVIK